MTPTEEILENQNRKFINYARNAKDGDAVPVPAGINLKDSGIRSQFNTGAVRDGQTGKGRMDLLPVRAIMEVSKIFEAGAIKYAARNWEKGIPLSRFMDSGLRHAFKWLLGYRDEPHLAQACWNFLCLLDTQLRIQEGELPIELNDLPCNPIDVEGSE